MLAHETTGKYVSVRHDEAKQAGKLTAGQMAAKLRRHFGDGTVKAAELKPHATEWHHSGFYKGSHGSTMGRTYFFPPDTDLEELYSRVCADRAEAARITEESDIECYFLQVKFRKRYGRRRGYQPVATFEIKICKPSDPPTKNATQISKEHYDLLKPFDGEELQAYETAAEFKERMLGTA